MDPLAEIQRYMNEIACDQLCIDSVLETLVHHDEFHAWVDWQAPGLLDRIRHLAVKGEYHAARQLAEGELGPQLHSAAADGDWKRSAIPDEIHEWKPLGHVARGETAGWLRGQAAVRTHDTSAPVASRGIRARVGKARSRQRRARRHVARATSSSDSGNDGSSEGDGDPPPPALLHALQLLGLGLKQVRWCRACGIFAFAIDDFEGDQLDRHGFHDGLCPACARKARP